MGLHPSVDSRTSLVTIDPAVAEQIHRVKAFHQQLSTEAKQHPPVKAPEPRLYPPDDIFQTPKVQARISAKTVEKARKNSLRHVKNSNEVLRQRSTRAQLGAESVDHASIGKEGRNFTVANVGTGGKLYLRPAASQPQYRLHQSFLFPSQTLNTGVHYDLPGQDYNSHAPPGSMWSNSQFSDQPAKAQAERSALGIADTSDKLSKPSSRTRALSFSTVDDRHKPLSEKEDGILRIVIDRSATMRPKTAEGSIRPTLSMLETPIPHYRLGKPEFSQQGTPILRSSAYTRTTEVMSEHLNPATTAKNDSCFPTPMGANKRGLSGGHTSHSSIDSISTSSVAGGDPAEAAHSSGNISYEEPIKPDVFDRLATFKDDAAVVRYSQKTGAITAATPARIVAQISSESFMDYELVSDFFLTFRAYLSTENLLGLLLARLRWAINRPEDDGRIIRIRTFAALRHWILNYFTDDFMVNRALRVQFCDQINDMYHEVSRRTGRGVSDLKILLDLKRCWNGRCSLYSDSPRAVVNAKQEADIVPGEGFAHRSANLTKPDIDAGQIADATIIDNSYQNEGSMAKTWYGQPPPAAGSKPRDKQAYTKSAKVPLSPTSEQSWHAASCSIPAIAFRRSPALEGHARGPCPVTLQPRKEYSLLCPPASMKDAQHRFSFAHKRCASTFDSIRDRGSADSISQPVFLTSPHVGSLIRGSLYPPAPPFVDVLAPGSPPSQKPRHVASAMGIPASCESGGKPGLPTNPGVKTLMGSIRRVLSSKQPGSTSASSGNEISRSAYLLQGKTSGLPLNMSRSSDTLRDKFSTTVPKHHLRIDLLCAAVSQSYQMAQAKASQDSFVNREPRVSVFDVHEGSGSEHSFSSKVFSTEDDDGEYVVSDDIRFGSRIIDGVRVLNLPNSNATGKDMQEVPFTDSDFTASDMLSMPLPSTETFRKQEILGPREHPRSSSVDTALARLSKDQAQSSEGAGDFSNCTQSSFHRATEVSRSRQLRSPGVNSAIPGSCTSKSSAELRLEPRSSSKERVMSLPPKRVDSKHKPQGPPHTLRRRPGGNLRDIENVHDLAPCLRRQSTGSLTTTSESVGSMLFIGTSRATESSHRDHVPPALQHRVSLIRTHSSQHLRPSFEAAISGFSAIPDDEDGGPEATLLKLEGKYKRRSPQITSETFALQNIPQEQMTSKAPSLRNVHQHHSYSHASISRSGQSQVLSSRSSSWLMQQASVSNTGKPGVKSISARSGGSKGSVAGSEGSYSSIPLLERGIVYQVLKGPKALLESGPEGTFPRPLPEKLAGMRAEPESESFDDSIEFVEKSESMGKIQQRAMLSDLRPPTIDGSFLLDEDDNLTDLSSELSMDVIDLSELRSPMASSSVPTPGTATSGPELPIHPLAHPPSPASSFHHAGTVAPVIHHIWQQQKPLTPQPSPRQGLTPPGDQMPVSQVLPLHRSATIGSATVTTSAGHIPFVLACQSEILAQQLTLVEKAALSEIEWSDLVDIKWDNKSPSILNWVEYLAAKDNKGIDIVIARFNIVVKWVLSEVVMTQNIYERARAITKCIHVAAHAKQIHNYATMLQITIALTSIDCTRLKATWELVAEADKTILKDMERLAQPIRNFHDLRVEMETVNLQDGCIPFVGLYLHDLTYNAQKPSHIVDSQASEPLVNFEKYRTMASIVKSLLRLIDASSKYNFCPIPGIIERCLWLAALSDDKIRAMSKSIQ